MKTTTSICIYCCGEGRKEKKQQQKHYCLQIDYYGSVTEIK